MLNLKGVVQNTFLRVDGRVVRSLLQLSERWPCHIWPVGRMKFALLDIWVGAF